MHPILIAFIIFLLRITDVSIGTIRVMYTIRGKRLTAAFLGVLESGIWIFAITRAMKHIDNPASMIGWAAGFATGTILGITMEKWIASGSILLRVISMTSAMPLRTELSNRGFGVTSVAGEGRSGPVHILFIVAPRRRGKEAMQIISEVDPKAFITVDPVDLSVGGYIPTVPSGMRK